MECMQKVDLYRYSKNTPIDRTGPSEQVIGIRVDFLKSEIRGQSGHARAGQPQR